MKVCSVCRVSKPITEFNKSKAAVDGFQNNCRQCSCAANKKWRMANPDKTRVNAENSRKNLLKRNPSYHRDFYAKQYATVEGRLRMITNVNNRRARLMQAEGDFTAEEFAELCFLYGNICLSCKESKTLTVDHVVPLSKGGNNTISNIQPLCKSCNSQKSSKTIDYRLGFNLE